MTILKNLQFVAWVWKFWKKISDFIIPCPSGCLLLVLVPSVGFSSIIVSGTFSVSHGMRLWETDLPDVLVNSRLANCNSLTESGQSSTSTNSSRFPKNCTKRRSSHVSHRFRSVTSGPFEAKVVLRMTFFSNFFDNFYNAFIQRRLVHNDGHDFLPKFVSAFGTSKFSLLHFAQVVNEYDDSPSSIFLYLWLLLLRWHCCRNKLCNLPLMKKCFCFLQYECVHLPCNIFTFISVCSQSSFCDRVMISCTIQGANELYSCKEFLV